MRRIIAGTLALLVLSSPCLLGAEGATKTKAKAKAKPKVVKKAAPLPMSAQMQQMKDQLNQQQQQINQLQQQLQQSNQQLQSSQQQLQSGVQQAAKQAQAAQQAASSAQQSANSLNSSVADLKTTTATVSQGLATTQKDVKELLSPLGIRYKGVSIAPIGFLEGAAFWRSRAVLNDTPTNYQTVPLNGTPLSAMNEFRFTSRNTIVGFTVDGKVSNSTALRGLFAMDFNAGNLVGQKFTSSNNWAPRIRWAAGEVRTQSGWRVLGGMYNVTAMLNRKLIETLTEWGPVGDDNSSFTGVGTFRQPMIRVTKNFMNNKAAVAISFEQADFLYSNDAATSAFLQGIPQATLVNPLGNLTIANPTLPSTPSCSLVTAGASLSTSTTLTCVNNLAPITTSIPVAPDIWVKAAFDPKPGYHIEVKGVARFFRDKMLANAVNTAGGAASNNLTVGGGAGLGFVVPATKKVDVVFNSLVGSGIGRYLSSNTQGGDVTLSGINCAATATVPAAGNCALVGVKALALQGGLEFHPYPKIDFNMYYGLEYYGRYNNTLGYVGNGIGDLGAKAGTDNKSIHQVMVTPVYRFYRGPYGTFQAMLSAQYSLRTTWAGLAANASAPTAFLFGNGGTAKGGEFVGVFSLRYVLP